MSDPISTPAVTAMEIEIGDLVLRYGSPPDDLPEAAGDVWLYWNGTASLSLGSIDQAEQVAVAIGRLVNAVRGDE